MAEVTDEAYQQCARETLQLYAAADGQFRVPVERTVKFQATFPLAMYALNQVHAALILADNRHEYLAVANVRVAYEHAVTAQWVLFTDGAEEKLVSSMNLHGREVIKTMGSFNQIEREVLDELSSGFGLTTDPTMPRFTKRCAELDGGKNLLVSLYQSLSVGVHPSADTMAQYLRFHPDGHVAGVSFAAVGAPPSDTWIGCALSALSAAYAIELQREGQPRMPQLAALSQRHQVPLDLRVPAAPVEAQGGQSMPAT